MSELHNLYLPANTVTPLSNYIAASVGQDVRIFPYGLRTIYIKDASYTPDFLRETWRTHRHKETVNHGIYLYSLGGVEFSVEVNDGESTPPPPPPPPVVINENFNVPELLDNTGTGLVFIEMGLATANNYVFAYGAYPEVISITRSGTGVNVSVNNNTGSTIPATTVAITATQI